MENKENIKDGLRLEDEALEGVSGGGLKTECIAQCIYCHVPHMMTRYSGAVVQYKNMIYKNCDRYVCDVRKYYFYKVTDYNGNQFYLDQWLDDK